ncbi:MAG: hypothetical protein MI807_14190, partial [Verrucomicrobiales bacterium]|nr:hypothetical protein [Verrucomicrobiales bacterium]
MGKNVTRSIIAAYFLLLFGHLTAVYCMGVLGRNYALGLVPTFYFDSESNLPTLFSGSILFLAGALSWFIGQRHKLESSGEQKTFYRSWFLVAGILIFLAID